MTLGQFVLYVAFSAVMLVLTIMFVTDFMANKCVRCGSRITFGKAIHTIKRSRIIHHDYIVHCFRCGHSSSAFQGTSETSRQE